jgi:lysophospholipase L1-like esterase
MIQYQIFLFVKLFAAVTFIFGSYCIIVFSNFHYLFLGNLLLLIGVAISVESFAELIFCKSSGRRKAVIYSIRSSFIVLFMIDLIIRLSALMQTYPEKADGNYFSLASQENLNSWYWTHPPNTRISNQKLEFYFVRNVNSLGISESEKAFKKKSNFRILALGDSFTEGVGTSYEDSWVKKMENSFNSRGVETINAGIGGSDPVFEFSLYKDKLIHYKPDILILTINSTDILDIINRGGFERFNSDGTTGLPPPTWEWIYAANHLFRMVIHRGFGFNSNLTRNTDVNESKAIEIIQDVLLRFKELTEVERTELLVVLQPSIQEFSNGSHKPFYGQSKLIKFLKEEDINFVDASIEFEKQKESISHFYYPVDTHFNQKGYDLFGSIVVRKIEELELLE